MTWTCIEQREQIHNGHGGNRVIRKLIFTEIFLDNVSVDVSGQLKALSDMEIKALTVSLYGRIIYQLIRNHLTYGLHLDLLSRESRESDSNISVYSMNLSILSTGFKLASDTV